MALHFGLKSDKKEQNTFRTHCIAFKGSFNLHVDIVLTAGSLLSIRATKEKKLEGNKGTGRLGVFVLVLTILSFSLPVFFKIRTLSLLFLSQCTLLFS